MTIPTYGRAVVFDKQGRMITSSEEDGFSVSLTYDEEGRLSSILDNIEGSTSCSRSFKYDQFGNMTRCKYLGGFEYKLRYDTQGNVTEYSDTEGDRSIYRYKDGVMIYCKNAYGSEFHFDPTTGELMEKKLSPIFLALIA